MRGLLFFSFLMLCLVGNFAEARVFNFSNNWVAAYIRGTGGLSNVDKDMYGKTSGNSTAFDKGVDYNFSGEIGFAILLSNNMTARLGIEGLQTKEVTVTGESALGAKYMDVVSRAVVFNPGLTFEYSFRGTGTSRLYGFAGAGYSIVKITNAYELTAAGTTAYSGASASYTDNWYANAINYHVGTGWEAFLFDNLTFNLDVGWRQLDVSGFKYNSDATVVRGGGGVSVTEGTNVTNNNGRKPKLDLGGYFVGMTFKFYIPPLN
ncbi:MAG: hypothetical protein A2Z20_02145 [Bdellovibrionales bacterium RBG_16_40_8]|nr:MAG: hypothetical protein A2Z20_02145 [Bdellovibrionales bacterium RBG_16_40_8]